MLTMEVYIIGFWYSRFNNWHNPLETFISFAEQALYMDAHGVMQLHIIINEFIYEKTKVSRQVDIQKMFKKFSRPPI